MAVMGLSSGNTDDNWWTNILLQLIFLDIIATLLKVYLYNYSCSLFHVTYIISHIQNVKCNLL